MVPMFWQAAKSGSDPVANPANLVNLYPEPVPQGGRTTYLLRADVGLSQWQDAGENWCAGMFPVDSRLYCVFGDHVHRFNGNGHQVILGQVQRGAVTMARNGDYLTITSGGQYYVVDDGDVTAPTAGAFDAFGSLTFMAGRTIISEEGGQRLQWSDVNDPSTLDGLNFGVADQRDDNILRVLNASGALMVFGQRSTEVWSATGQAGPYAFALIPGAVKDTGLLRKELVTLAGGAAFMVANDGIVYIAAGTEWKAISPPQVNRSIEENTATGCVYWEDGGHKFAAVLFEDRPAWVYDLVTGLWHTRSEGREEGPWRAAAAVLWRGQWHFGAHNGIIYRASRDGTDAGEIYYRRATGLPIHRDGRWFTVNRLAVGASNGLQAEQVQLMLEVSRDGATWGRAIARDIGFEGDFRKRAEWRALGRSKQMVFRVSLTDPCDVSLWSDVELDAA